MHVEGDDGSETLYISEQSTGKVYSMSLIGMDNT
jgi:hypothetical protein